MYEILKAILLGIIQGLTEFLPVSSSGHLEIAKVIMNDDSMAQLSMMTTIVLHFATALSTIVVFRKEVWEIIMGLLQFRWNEQMKFSLKILVSLIPAAALGYIYEDELKTLFDHQLLLVGLMLIVTGMLLVFADRAKPTQKKLSYFDAFLIGIAQAIAIIPGISRSGATISASVLLGVDKEKAARFSFLMVIPLIMGKVAKDFLSGDINYEQEVVAPLVVGFIAAFITGLIACTWMIRLVKSSKLEYFSYYCFIVATLAIVKALV